jgi:hypothetical protein
MTGNNMFPIDLTQVQQKSSTKVLAAVDKEDSVIWHKRYGHMYEQGLRMLNEKSLVYGFPSRIKSLPVCESCALGKQVKRPFPKSAVRATRVLELLHNDLCGPMPVPSLGRSLYYFLIVDDYN